MRPSGTADADRRRDDRGEAIARLLARVIRRAWIADLLTAVAVAAIVVASGTAGGARGVGWAAGSTTAVVMLWRGRLHRTMPGAATLVERACPDCRNVVITAEELLRHPGRAASWIRARVLADAARSAAAVPSARVVPLARPIAMVLVLGSIAGLLMAGWGRGMAGAIGGAVARLSPAAAVSAASPMTIIARVTPPTYTGLPARQDTNPARIAAVQGSVIRLAVTGSPGDWRIRFGATPLKVSVRGGETIAESVLSDSGYFAIEPGGAGDAPPGDPRSPIPHPERLLPVVVTPDRAPVIHLDAPGRDLLLRDAKSAVALAASASDDFGLQSLELRYTKVSGTGEQFEFEEGSLPLAVTRASDVAWKAAGQIPIPSLKLEPGDALVYRAVARDRRPGDAGLASSDTFFIEIAGPGQVALEGFEMPPDQEKYALSQQMIVLKIQRLRARERTLARDALREATEAIAAEQRAVRANFIFLMGGHVEDEEEEAEQSSDIQEGRLRNTARQEINAAITYMSRVEQALIGVSTGAALPPAKAAVEALQRAFGRNRYILRTLPVRSRVDPSRRLTGELSAASDWRREIAPATLDPATRDARALLSDVLELAAVVRRGQRVDPAAFNRLAEQALAIDPGAAAWQEAARRLGLAREAASSGRPPAEVTSEITAALVPIVARAQRDARLAGRGGTRAPGALLGAWAEESRR